MVMNGYETVIIKPFVLMPCVKKYIYKRKQEEQESSKSKEENYRQIYELQCLDLNRKEFEHGQSCLFEDSEGIFK